MKINILFLIIIVALLVIIVDSYITTKQLRSASDKLVELNQNYHDTCMELKRNAFIQSNVTKRHQQINRKLERKLELNAMVSLGSFEVTAYDLSVKSCGKRPGDKSYGVTANGTSLINKSREEASAIAVDPKVIPLGTEVYITFKEEGFEAYNGFYTAVDTGGTVKGNIIDLFMGDFGSELEHKSVPEFGRRKAEVYVVK